MGGSVQRMVHRGAQVECDAWCVRRCVVRVKVRGSEGVRVVQVWVQMLVGCSGGEVGGTDLCDVVLDREVVGPLLEVR